jgi:hypothetical protein
MRTRFREVLGICCLISFVECRKDFVINMLSWGGNQLRASLADGMRRGACQSPSHVMTVETLGLEASNALGYRAGDGKVWYTGVDASRHYMIALLKAEDVYNIDMW